MEAAAAAVVVAAAAATDVRAAVATTPLLVYCVTMTTNTDWEPEASVNVSSACVVSGIVAVVWVVDGAVVVGLLGLLELVGVLLVDGPAVEVIGVLVGELLVDVTRAVVEGDADVVGDAEALLGVEAEVGDAAEPLLPALPCLSTRLMPSGLAKGVARTPGAAASASSMHERFLRQTITARRLLGSEEGGGRSGVERVWPCRGSAG